MAIAELVLNYIQALIWPLVVISIFIFYRDTIQALFKKSDVKFSLFGVTIETSIGELEKTITSTLDGELTPQQWTLLEEIWQKGQVSVEEKNYSMSIDKDLRWMRPVRNLGLIMTLPDGKYIEQAEHIILTPLGRLLMRAKREK